MEITKPLLQVRHAGMTQQLARLLEETAMIHGAINFCEALMEYLATVEAKPPEPEPEGTPELPESGDGEAPEDAGIDTIQAREGFG